MIQRQLKLKLTCGQEKTLDQWLWYLTGVYNWAVRKIELDANDKVFHTEFDLCAMLKGHSERLGIPDNVLRGTLNTAYAAWKRRFKGLSGRPKLKGECVRDLRAALSAAPARDGVREALRWALDWIADGTNPEIGDTPEHGCAYFQNPVAGHCEWHERYFAARELLAKEQADGL